MPTSPFTYAFQPKEEIGEGFARMLGEIAKRGRELARNSSGPAGESIHGGRLLIKRLRALLWFVRPALNDEVLAKSKEELRNAAGILGGHRDLSVAQATLKKLEEKASTAREREALQQTSRQLGGESGAAEATEQNLRQSLKQAMGMVGSVVSELKRNVSQCDRWPSPWDRVEKASRAEIKAGKKARRTGDDTAFHDWRKKAKRLFYQLELTQPEMGKKHPATIKKVEKLQEKLGQYHDDVMVEARLREEAPASSSAKRALKSLAKEKTHLRKKAKKLARRAEARL